MGNQGNSTILRADGSPDLNSYLRSPALAPGASVDVQGLTGNITSATLRIYANSASTTGYTLKSVTDNTWTETSINSSNAPAMGTQLGTSGAITAGACLLDEASRSILCRICKEYNSSQD